MLIISKQIILAFSLGCFLIILGLSLTMIFPIILRNKISEEMRITQDGELFEVWKNVSVPIFMEFYFFNVTNANEVVTLGHKPRLQELGPYLFREKREKVNITWNDDDTVSYREIKRWFHVSGDLDAVVTSVNVPFLAAFMHLRNSLLISYLKKIPLFVEHSVGEFLFQGYYDQLLNLAKGLGIINVPTAEFGWFNMLNDTEGKIITIYTGEKNSAKTGIIHEFDGLPYLKYWESPCNKLNGTVGEFWPPNVYRKHLPMFITDLCRSITMTYDKNERVDDIETRRYVVDKTVFDTGTYDEENKCFCKEQCFPAGAMEVSSCHLGAPALVSLPHFLMGDASYLDFVDGLQPNFTKHGSHLYLEPKMGLPVRATAKFQINVFIHPNKKVNDLKYVNKTKIFPVFWFTQKAMLTEELAGKLRLVTEKLSLYVDIASYCFIGLGFIIVLLASFRLFVKAKRVKKEKYKPTNHGISIATISNGSIAMK